MRVAQEIMLTDEERTRLTKLVRSKLTSVRRAQRVRIVLLAGIERDLPRGAPPLKVDTARLVELTTQGKPVAATHWSTRKLAAELGVSASTVMRPLARPSTQAARHGVVGICAGIGVDGQPRVHLEGCASERRGARADQHGLPSSTASIFRCRFGRPLSQAKETATWNCYPTWA